MVNRVTKMKAVRRQVRKEGPFVEVRMPTSERVKAVAAIRTTGAQVVESQKNDLSSKSCALCLGIGNNLSEGTEMMDQALRRAVNQKIPVILDGAGLDSCEQSRKLAEHWLSQQAVTVLKGTPSEICSLMATPPIMEEEAEILAELSKLSQNYHTTVVMTGKVAYVVIDRYYWKLSTTDITLEEREAMGTGLIAAYLAVTGEIIACLDGLSALEGAIKVCQTSNRIADYEEILEALAAVTDEEVVNKVSLEKGIL